MGASAQLDISGAKGGQKQPKAPVEAPDSLQSTNIAKMLLAVGEGEFDGTPTDQDIYLDNTPIRDANGNVNFPGVKWEWRSGSVEQEYIQGIPAVENETTVGLELRSDNPFSRALSDIQLSAVRVRLAWPRLLKQESNGNTNGYRIEYAIDIATDGGAYVEAHRGAVDGKTNNGYQRSVRVNLPKASDGWMLRVRRITPNANSGTVADTMTIAGYTEIIDQKLRYPNTALLYIEFDAQQFQNIPAVTVNCKARRWPVPSNYDPIARTYNGIWDGTFKQAWTNNPALVTYGLCVEDRFGLGKRIKPWMVDKWEMYRIAQYCDQRVPDGIGGEEPRFLCDLNLQGRAEAWTLLRDLSAIYRGMVYWAHGALFMQADMPRAQDIDYVFTRANVIDGDFVYGGAERNTHYSRALVSYDNPANNYDTDVIPVTDQNLQRRYRDRPVEISAIACTRASEAQRRGKWALLSNNQDRTVTFRTGMEGRIPLPGFVIPVADELVAGRPNGGRISAASGRVITLDRDTPVKAGDRLIINLPNGTAQARTVQTVSGRAVTVTTAYGVPPEPQLQWAIDYADLAVQLFRVLKTTRTQQGDFEITALEFNPSKFAAIDSGAKLDERPISVIPVTTVQPPASVTLSSTYAVDQGIGVNTLNIAWPAVEGAMGYEVEWRKDNGNWIRLQRSGATSVEVVGIYAGAYVARVRAVSAFEITSIWRDSLLTQLDGKYGLPPLLASLRVTPLVFGTRLNWAFPKGAEDTQRTEIWQSATTSRDDATKLGDFAYPQAEHEIHGLAAGVTFFYWARLIDRSGNVGPWFPNGVGINGQSSSDQSEYDEYFKDKITNGSLYPALREEIALISGPPSLPGSVNSRLKDLDDQVAKAQSDLQEQIDAIADLADSLPYDPAKAYEVGQAVLGADGKLYQAKQAVPVGTPPPSAAYWTDIGQAVQAATGLAARVTTVETKVTEQDGKLTAQAERIDGVQSSLTVTNQNVTAAQRAADAANTLAGGKGKVIIQSAAPAVADRLAQNLWIDTTNNANTPKRWTGSAWMAVTDKAATDAAAAAASATALAKTKADASVVDTLSSKVTQQGDSITSQGQALTGLQNNLTVTNQNVTAAQQAAQDAATAAGAKGKVIVQSAAPAVADRLAQNLWIDTTGNANTPKRWTGSAWVAVTDKVATDAAAAAASALSQVALKADASTVQQLSNAVTQQGQTITAQGGAITSIQATVGSIGGSGVNLVPAEYSYFASAAAPSYIYGAQITATVPDAMGLGGYVLRTTSTTSTPSATIYTAVGTDAYENYRIATQRGKFIVSYYARADVAGHEVALFLRTRDSAGAAANAATIVQALTTEWALYSFVVDHSAATYANKDRMAVGIQFNRSGAAGRVVYWDRFMVEPMIGSNAQPSTFLVGGSYNQANALAAATQSLDSRVSQTESGLTSQGSAITQLRNTVAGKADNSALQDLQSNVTQQDNILTAQGQAVTKLQSTVGGIGGSGTNLLADDYSWLTSTSLPAMVMGSSLARVGVPVSASDSGFGILCTFPSTAVGQFMMLSPSNNLAGWNVRIEPGVYLVSMYIQGSAEGSAMVSLYSGTHRQSGNIPYSTERSRITFPITVVDSAKVGITIYPNRTGLAAGQSVTIDSVMIEKRVGESNVPSPFVAGPSARAVSGQATAISQLNTTVNQQGSAITAQAERVDGLYVQINPELSGSEDGFAGSAQKFVGVWSEQSARIEGDVAQARRTDQVEAQQGQTSAVVQQVSTAVATLDGKVNAQVTIKAQTIAGGRKVTAGLALGSDGETSEFLAFAQRFAVVDEVSGQLVLPFVVQNGQVFINEAIVSKATITNALIGSTITSVARTTSGDPVMEADFNNGRTLTRHPTRANTYTITDRDGIKVYVDGVLRVRMGVW